MPRLSCTVFAALFALAGCGVGGASFSGDFGGQTFAPVGTVFAFIDALEPAPELKGRDKPRVVLAMTYAAFDPGYDQETRSGTELADLRHAIEIGTWVSMRFDDRAKMGAGSSYTDVLLAGRSDGRFDESDDTSDGRSEGFRARFGVAREPLQAGASYSDYAPYGTRALATVHLDEVQLDAGAEIRGRLTLKIERAEGDSADARTGTVEGDFVARVIGERIAEKNAETLNLYRLLEIKR